MTTQEKEKIKELARKAKDLEGVISQKDQLLGDYQNIEKIADEKIKGLNAIHGEKIRSLMQSIQLLKKENASLSKQSKEHKRSEFIQQLNKDIADQDTVIEVLRGIVNDDKKADAAIIKELSKGPPRIRVQTREELKMDITELKSKLTKYERKKEGTQVEEKPQSAVLDDKSKLHHEARGMLMDKSMDKIQTGNADFILKINDLNNEIEDLKLVVSGKNAEIEKYKELNGRKNQEILELNQAKIDLKFVVTKNEELKAELEALRLKMNSDVYINYDQQIKMEEMELVANTHKNINFKNTEVARLEMDSLQAKLEEFAKTNKQLLMGNKRLQEELSTYKNQNEEFKEKNRKLFAGQTDEIERLAIQLKERETNIKTLTADIADYEDKLDDLTAELQNKEIRIRTLEERVVRGSLQLEASSIGHLKESRLGLETEELSRLNESLEDKRDDLESEINTLKQENLRLRMRVKELTKIEIELEDKVEMLEDENRMKNLKINAMNLIQRKNYNDTMTPEEVRIMIKKSTDRYEARLRETTQKIEELERRNQELEHFKRIMHSPKNSKTGGFEGDQDSYVSMGMSESKF
jgi:chromosome segregation ATPase